jgi:hypothetical protein
MMTTLTITRLCTVMMLLITACTATMTTKRIFEIAPKDNRD